MHRQSNQFQQEVHGTCKRHPIATTKKKDLLASQRYIENQGWILTESGSHTSQIQVTYQSHLMLLLCFL